MTILKKFLQQNKGLALLTFVMICLQIAGTLGVPKLVAKLIDTGIASGEASVIKKIGVEMLLVAFLGTIAAVASSYFSANDCFILPNDFTSTSYLLFHHPHDVSLFSIAYMGYIILCCFLRMDRLPTDETRNAFIFEYPTKNGSDHHHIERILYGDQYDPCL